MQIGILGTGYAAKARAQVIQSDGRATLRWIAGHHQAQELAQTFDCPSYDDPRRALEDPAVDLVIICNASLAHAPMVEEALRRGKQVVVEYPLALDYPTGQKLLELAQDRQLFLHVEHIELLSDLHSQLRATLPALGSVHYARSVTLTAAHPAPRRWSYHRTAFGFPLVGALSRVSRLIDLLGPVDRVYCQNQYLGSEADYFQTCHCVAQLHFVQGTVAEILYAKGEGVWHSEMSLDFHGQLGAIQLRDSEMTLLSQGNAQSLATGSRKGLFLRDTQQVLDHLLKGTPLYTTASQSLYALQVASACAESAEKGEMIEISRLASTNP